MIFWIRLISIFGVFCLSAFTVIKAPGLVGWKIAILVTEFGHVLVLYPIAILIWLYFSGESGPRIWVSVLLCSVCSVLLLRPVVNAAFLAHRLPMISHEASGVESPAKAAPLQYSRLFKFSVDSVGVEELVYSTRDGEHLLLDLYRPAGFEVLDSMPCIIVIHGGGWDRGDRKELSKFSHWLANRGYAVAAIDYRLAPESRWPAPKVDLLDAIEFLKKESGSLRIDPSRFALFGRSAGGQIATAVAHDSSDPTLRCVAAFYAPHDLDFAWRYGKEDDVLNSLNLLKQYLGGSPEAFSELYKDASAYSMKHSAQSIPTLLVHGKLDTLVWVKQSRRFKEVLDRDGAPAVFLEIPWATHGFDFNPNGPSAQLAYYTLEKFLKDSFRRPLSSELDL